MREFKLQGPFWDGFRFGSWVILVACLFNISLTFFATTISQCIALLVLTFLGGYVVHKVWRK